MLWEQAFVGTNTDSQKSNWFICGSHYIGHYITHYIV